MCQTNKNKTKHRKYQTYVHKRQLDDRHRPQTTTNSLCSYCVTKIQSITYCFKTKTIFRTCIPFQIVISTCVDLQKFVKYHTNIDKQTQNKQRLTSSLIAKRAFGSSNTIATYRTMFRYVRVDIECEMIKTSHLLSKSTRYNRRSVETAATPPPPPIATYNNHIQSIFDIKQKPPLGVL